MHAQYETRTVAYRIFVNGGVTPERSRVLVNLAFSTEATAAYESPAEFTTFDGDGFRGTVTVGDCLTFGNAVWVDVTLMIVDEAGSQSNGLTARIDRPEGAI
jgi:hypothetical protein